MTVPEAEPVVPSPREPSRQRRGRLIGVALSGVAAALAATGLATRLDRPTQLGPKDAAPIIAGPVIIDDEETFGATGLPPFALVLERPVPADLSRLPRPKRLKALRDRAVGGDPAILVQLGAAEQRTGEQGRARQAFEKALSAAPDNLAAQIGLAFTNASAGGSAAGEAALLLQRLADEHPSDQLVSFNRGWLAAYRRDATTALLAWRQALEIDPSTALGATARGLIIRVRATP